MVTECGIYIQFNNGLNDKEFKDKSGNKMTGSTFYFDHYNLITTTNPPSRDYSSYNTEQYHEYEAHGGFEWKRALNKNIIATSLPTNAYDGGGLCVDIGMSEDTFEFNYHTYSFDEYRYLYALIKLNCDLSIGTLHFENINGITESFAVGCKNIDCSFEGGEGFHCVFRINLIVVDKSLVTSNNSTEMM